MSSSSTSAHDTSDANRSGDKSPGKQGRQLPLGRKLLYAVLSAVIFFGLVEGVLRVAGFQVTGDVERMQFTFPIDEYNSNADEPFLRRDDELFWTPRPNVMGHNSHGLWGKDFEDAKTPGVTRVVCLGDSCTHFGPLSYPEVLQQMLDADSPGKFEVINAGTIGYTSYQGKKMMELRVREWQPDIVTVYFGWNDHWHARGLMDKEQVMPAETAGSSLINSLRSVQLIQMLGGRFRRDPLRMRVELSDYESNLTSIAESCKEIGAETWFLTAPHAMDLSVPEYLIESGEVSNPNTLVLLHQSYNEVVRTVSEKTASRLVDLEATFDGLPKSPLFVDDHIHLTPEGKQLVASRLFESF